MEGSVVQLGSSEEDTVVPAPGEGVDEMPWPELVDSDRAMLEGEMGRAAQVRVRYYGICILLVLVYCSCNTPILLMYYTTHVLLLYCSCTTPILLLHYSFTTATPVLLLYVSCPVLASDLPAQPPAPPT